MFILPHDAGVPYAPLPAEAPHSDAVDIAAMRRGKSLVTCARSLIGGVVRYTQTIVQLQQDPRYPSAKNVLNALLRFESPEIQDLVNLYGVRHAQTMHSFLGRHLEQKPLPQGVLRPHNYEASTDISNARSFIEESLDYLNLQADVLFGDVPAIERLEPLYGKYASQVREIIRLFIVHRRKRKCGISSVAHLNRVGAVAHQLRLDDVGEHEYATVAFMHDALEDLLDEVRDEHGQVYGVFRYREFLDRFMAPELHYHLRLITNFFDLILLEAQKMIRAEDKALTKENLIHTLVVMYQRERVDIHPYLEKVYDVIDATEFNGDIALHAKWLCYSELYIKEMARYTHSNHNYRAFEIKGIDLSDNGHGRDALALDSRLKNMLKQQIYATFGAQLNSDWYGLNKCVAELQEDVLVHAEHTIIQDLLQRQSSMDFVASTLGKMRDMRSIFFLPERRAFVHH